MDRQPRSRKAILDSIKSLKLTQVYSEKKPFQSLPQKKILKIDLPSSTSSTAFSMNHDKSNNHLLFSTLTRFNNTIFEKFKVRPFQAKTLSPNEKKALTARLNTNRDMTPHSMMNKTEKFTQIMRKKKVAQILANLTKQELCLNKTQNFKSVLDNKFRGFLIRQNKKENIKIKVTWICLFIVVSVCREHFQQMEELKALKVRNLKRWKAIRRVIKPLSAFLGVYRRVKVGFAMKVLRYKFLPVLKNWLGKLRNYKKLVVLHSIERFLMVGMKIKSIKKLKNSVFFIQILIIQRNFRRLMRIRKIVYKNLRFLWDKYEIEYKKSGNEIKKLEPSIKIEYIRHMLKIIIKKELKIINEHKQLNQNSNLFWTEVIKPSQNSKISLERLFTKQLFITLIRQAQHN